MFVTSSRSIRISTTVVAVLLFSVLMVFSGCGNKESAQAAGPNAAGGGRPPAPVVVSTVERRDVPLQISAIGNVEPYQTVQVRSMVSGQIEKILFKEGDDVRKGQLLYSLDQRPFEATVEQAEGNLKRDQAQAAN